MARRLPVRGQPGRRLRTAIAGLALLVASIVGSLVEGTGAATLPRTNPTTRTPGAQHQKEQSDPFVPGEVLVRFKSGTPEARIRQAHAVSHARILRTFDLVPNLQLVQAPFFDKPDRITASGVHRGLQRRMYDERKRRAARAQGYKVVEIEWSRKRKPKADDIDELRRLLVVEGVLDRGR